MSGNTPEMHRGQTTNQLISEARLTRRSFICRAARAALIGAVGLPVLAACGGTAAPGSSAAAPSAAPSSPAASRPAASAASGAASAAPASAASAAAGGKQYGGVVKILGTFKPQDLGYPAQMAGGDTYVGPGPLEPLLNLDKSLHFQPTGLATGYDVAKDGMSVTMTLRKGVKFHDGTDFNAAAAKWNLEQAIKAKTFGTSSWKSIDAVDDSTVRLNLAQPDGTFPALLGRQIGFMVSPTSIQKNSTDWARTHPVGTGPYKLKSFERDTSLKFERFDGYWGGKPYLDGLEWTFVSDEMVQETAFKAGEANVLYQASTQQWKDLHSGNYDIKTGMAQLATLVPDSGNPDSPLSKLQVRQALEYAIDKKSIAASLGYGTWRAADQPGLEEYPLAYDPNLKGRAYDPAKAKQLLAEAGYPNGFKIRIITDVDYKAGDSLTAVQDMWKKVGADTSIETIQRAKMDEYRSKGWSNAYVYTQMVLDPMYLNTLDRFLSTTAKVYVSASRPTGWADMFKTARAQTNPDAMAEKAKAMVKTIQEQASILPLWAMPYIIILDKHVHDTGFMEKFHALLWSPEKAWLSK